MEVSLHGDNVTGGGVTGDNVTDGGVTTWGGCE